MDVELMVYRRLSRRTTSELIPWKFVPGHWIDVIRSELRRKESNCDAHSFAQLELLSAG